MPPEFTLLEGDCRALLPALRASTVRCCITSPPYWSGPGAEGEIGKELSPAEYAGSLVSLFRQVRRILTGAGSLWLVLGDHPAARATGVPHRVAQALAGDDWHWNGEFVWEEADAVQSVFQFGNRAGPTSRDAASQEVWRFTASPEVNYRWSVLPVELASRCVMRSSLPGDTVLDPFCGLGSVGVAALKAGRSFVGIERERRVLQRAWERLRRCGSELSA
jgi:DNA modification methylase